MTRDDLRVVIQFLLDFGITAGSILGGSMLESGTATLPKTAVLVLALIMGFIAAARRADATMKGQPQENLEATVRQLVAQMRTVHLAAAQTLPEPGVPASKLPKDSS